MSNLSTDHLADTKLEAVQWLGDDLGLAFVVLKTHGLAHQKYYVRCISATEVCIDLDFGALSGMALVWEANVTIVESSRILVIDFGGAPDGHISVRCDSIKISSDNW
jgi:hypothetical protein